MTPPTIRYFALGELLACDFGDGRCAVRDIRSVKELGKSGYQYVWMAAEPPDPSVLWPAPAYTEQAGVGDAKPPAARWVSKDEWECDGAGFSPPRRIAHNVERCNCGTARPPFATSDPLP